MDLKKFINAHSELAEFDPSIGQSQREILDLISKPMNLLGLKLAYDRSPDFDALLKAQGLKYKTIISKKNSRLTGLFSISTSPRLLANHSIDTAYLGDFRIENDRRIAAFWRKNYSQALELMSKSNELNCPELFITAILQENKLARKSLVENPKAKGDFTYHFLRTVEMTNVISTSLFKSCHPGISVRYARADEENRIRNFTCLWEKEKILGFDFVRNGYELWNQRKKNIPGFEATRFLMVEDRNHQLLGVALPWSPDSLKRMVLKDMTWPLKTFFSSLGLFGLNLPKENQSIKTLYLTHLNMINSIEPKIVVSSLINWLFKNYPTKEFHMISFANWWNLNWKEYIKYSVAVNLYEVTSSSASSKLIDKDDLFRAKAFGFEMALV